MEEVMGRIEFSTVQQIIRITAFTLGGVLLGGGITEDPMYERAVGGLISLAALGWWLLGFEKPRLEGTKK
jgi:Na+-driven multidrug efflux pump